MDYEAIDRAMGRCVLTCEVKGTRFFLTPEGLASDIPSRAKVYRDRTDAALSRPDWNTIPHGGSFRWEPEPAFVYEVHP